MVERRQDLGFALEALHARGILGNGSGKDLDGDVAAELGVERAIASPMPPAQSLPVIR